MKEEDFIQDIEKAEKDVEHEDHFHKKDRKHHLIYAIVALLMLSMFVLWYIPADSIKLDPEPKNIPSLESLYFNVEMTNETHLDVQNPYEYRLLLTPSDPAIKSIADRIVVESCSGDERVCYAKALFYFVRDEFDYVNDPLAFEYVKSAKESLVAKGGDCDDASVLLASLLRAVGFNTRFVFIPGHVYVQVSIPESVQKYKQEQDWINVDATCKNCAFGEVPFQSNKAEKIYV